MLLLFSCFALIIEQNTGKGEQRVAKRVGKGIGLAVCILGCLWFCLPLLRGGFGLGSWFGFFVCALGAALLLGYGRCARKGGWTKACARLVLAFYLMGLGWAAFLTGCIFSTQFSAPPEDADVLVLGAQILPDGRMSLSLRSRIEAASQYLIEHPYARCIVAGGKGDDEPCSEARVMAQALEERGIATERIFQEDRSFNTRQNMTYAAQLADKEGLGPKFAVVSQGYHLFRAIRLAKQAGLEAVPLPAYTDPLIFPQYYGRELLSLTKWVVEQQIMEE